MDTYVIVATRGRPLETRELVGNLKRQTLSPKAVVVVGADPADVVGIDAESGGATRLEVVVTGKAGLCAQRNRGLERIVALAADRQPNQDFCVAFFDDDFRPAPDWLERCREVFQRQSEIAALTGWVLADGVNGAGLDETLARTYLAGSVRPDRHWASGNAQRDVTSLYGCNMAFRDRVVTACRFDENLPLYGWQEDQDYTSQARALGRTVFEPTCKGVHLGIRSGRVSGLRFGYSQIANSFYLTRKGTMPPRKAARFVARHLTANIAKSLLLGASVDYPGRLKGNLLAILDLLRGRCDPRRVMDLG